MRYKTQINTKNEVRIWDLENPNELGLPLFFQPHWADGTAWANKEEATNWAAVFVESKENPNSEFLPGDSPSNHPITKPKQ